MAKSANISDIKVSSEHAVISCPDLLSNNESCTRLLAPGFDKLAIIQIDRSWKFNKV